MRVVFGLLLYVGVALSGYAPVDQSMFESFAPPADGHMAHSHGNQFRASNHVKVNGKQKVKFEQYYDGLRVMNTGAVGEMTNEGVKDVEGEMFDISTEDANSFTVASISGFNPVDVAISYKKKELKKEELHVEEDTIQVELVVNPTEDGKHAEKVYFLNFYINDPVDGPSRPYFFIDYATGIVTSTWEGLDLGRSRGTYQDGLTQGRGPGGNTKTGKYEYGKDYPAMEVYRQGKMCASENNNVKSIDLQHSTKAPKGDPAFQYSCPDSNQYNKGRVVNGGYAAINDAHFFGNVLYDMYKTWCNVAPLKFKLLIKVHYGNNYENAFWNGRELTFGDGRNTFYPLVDINVVTHEAAHGFTEQNSGLIYSAQSGGMNEAYSDIAGEAAEMWMKKRVDWMVGADIMKRRGAALRYFKNPEQDGRSIGDATKYYNGMDVHHSSGVYNKAYYLISSNKAWASNEQEGVREAFKMFTIANQLYWSQRATYNTGACGTIKAAKDMGKSSSQVQAVRNAFAAVKVNPTC